ncbi:hypothetical protein PASLES2_20130 [Pseudomonas aeruginosa]
MSFDADEEILQDFLVEAGEILEQLSEQLVELESRPDDMDLLNAIFRGFHTVKGGAGFLQLNALVECCHIAENVFDILRKGERRVSSELMDVVLQALDTVNAMFDQVRGVRTDPGDARSCSAALAGLASLRAPRPRNLCKRRRRPFRQPSRGAAGSARAECLQRYHRRRVRAVAGCSPGRRSAGLRRCRSVRGSRWRRDQRRRVRGVARPVARQGQVRPAGGLGRACAMPAEAVEPAAAAAGDDISDDEFEALLDELHGKGKFGDVPEAAGTPLPHRLPRSSGCAGGSRARRRPPRAATRSATTSSSRCSTNCTARASSTAPPKPWRPLRR